MTIALCVLGLLATTSVRQTHAAIVGYLSEPVGLTGERFQSELFFAASADEIGNEIELFNLDIVNSTINGSPLTEFSVVSFLADPEFVAWQDSQQFGATLGFESQVTLDAFAGSTSLPRLISDTTPFRAGTLVFDYSTLGLSEGDFITLDVIGRDDGSASRTTSVAIRDTTTSVTALIDPDFSTPQGPGQRTFSITAIPEPTGCVGLLGIAACVLIRRRTDRYSLAAISE